MNILQKMALWTAQKAGISFSLSDTGISQKLGHWLNFGGTYTGKAVTDVSAMQVTTVWACVRLLAETMGAMPSKVFAAEKSGNATPAEDHPLNEILVYQPCADMNGMEAREARTANLALRGNSYCVIERRGSGDVNSLYAVSAASVQIKRDQTTDWEIRYGVPDRGQTEWYPAEKIWHTKGFSFNGMAGLSPIAYAREAMALALAGEEFNARLFGQGLSPSARVIIPNWLSPEQRKIANAKIAEMHTGLANLNKPMLLEGGMKVESGLITPDDAQFLQLRQFTVIEICRLFNIKPHMVASLEQATNNNIEQLSLEFVTYTMLPYVRREEMAARKLFKPADRNKFFYRYNFEGLLRADSVARAQLYSILLQNGVFNRNEVRALESRNNVDQPAMNEFTVQSNMAMIEQLAALVAARSPAPAPAPVKSGDTIILNSTPAPQNVSFTAPDVKVSNTPAQVNVAPAQVTVSPSMEVQGMADATKAMAEALIALRTEMSKPRKAVFDGNGEVIGSESVDALQ